MMESMQAKASKFQDGVDMISNLPDPILHLILSHLQGTEEAIRTSILSRRWRYLWTWVPSINIDYARGLKTSQQVFDRNGFRDFVNWVLANKSLHLDSFRLLCGNYYDMSTVGMWIKAAVMRKVKVVDLKFRPLKGSEDIVLPQCLVTCGSLEVLRLYLMGYPLSLPKLIGFQALRVLELRSVDLDNDDNIVKYFLESCQSLEDLSLIDCRACDIVISCPKLKNLGIHTRLYSCATLEICCDKLEFLKLTGRIADILLFEGLDSLKKAVIHAERLSKVKPPFDFFSRISHVEYMSICIRCITECFHPIYNELSISLPNLKTLEIIVDWINMCALIPFLRCVPDLESLHLIIPKELYLFQCWSLDDAETMRALTRHLKKVEFLAFDEEKPKLDIACALLEHGNLLEEMVFSWDDEVMFHERSMESMKEVSGFHKASSTVKLTTVFNPTRLEY